MVIILDVRVHNLWLTIITTKVGARVLDLKHGEYVIISEIDEFPEWIETLIDDKDLRYKLGCQWKKIS